MGHEIPIEWGAFAPEALSPKVRAFNEMTVKALAATEPLHMRNVVDVRAERSEWARVGLDSSARWLQIESRAGPLRLRVLDAHRPRGIYLHLHGGGWVLGGADHQDRLLAAIRERAQVTVVSVEYRLAPEHPFPAAVEDAEDAARFLLERGTRALGVDQLVIGGESAGANLAVVTLARLRAHGNVSNIRGACLQYGTYDLSGTPSLFCAPNHTPFLDRATSQWFRAHYAPEQCWREPDVSPLYADLSQFPPAQFLVGTADPVVDDTLFMYARWRAAGNRASLVLLPGGLHGVAEHNTPLTQQARAYIGDFVSERLPLL